MTPVLAVQYRRFGIADGVLLMSAVLASLALFAGAIDDEIVIPKDNIIPATLNGRAIRLRVDPGAPVMPMLTPDLVAALQVKAGPFGAIGRVGPVRLPGKSAVVRFGLPGSAKEKKARVIWFDRALVDGADAVVSPLFLHQNRVRFELGGQGGRRTELPIADLGGRSRGVLLPVAGETVEVTFPLWRRDSAVTADAGRLIALDHDGRLAPGAGARVEIAFGVSRPYRELKLARPVAIGPFALSTLKVRMPDSGSAGIAEADADPDEIIVSADSKQKPNRALSIARDQLDRCAWLETDRAAGTIRFDCPAG